MFTVDQILAVNVDAPTEVDLMPSPLVWVLSLLYGVGYLAYVAFLIWMAVECLRKDPQRFLWIWVLFIIQPIGPFLYFFVRWLPSNDLRMPKAFKVLSRKREIERLSVAAQQIGNAHQFLQLADALREAGKTEQAAEAYSRAIEKDPENTQALWGAALVDFGAKRYPAARENLNRVLALDPQYKFGDVSLLYGKTLYEMGEDEAARDHLEQHIKRWRHPEALYVLASLDAERGRVDEARAHLQALLLDINGSPKAIARRHMAWKSKAQKMLRGLPRAGSDA
jgi:hypothetical protein